VTVVCILVLLAGGNFIGLSNFVNEPCVYGVLEPNFGGFDTKLNVLQYSVTMKIVI
jgi:hypothetical protein